MTQNRKASDPLIISAARTPMGRFQGGLSGLPATRLGAAVVRAVVDRAGILDSEQIDEVLMGSVVSAGLGQAPARQAAIFAGLPPTVGATTINKVCGSGLKSGMLAAQAIKAGDGSLFVAGGMESMSSAPFLVYGRGGELRYGNRELIDALLYDGLWDPFEDWAMGMAAEWIADEYHVTREAMDEWSFESHMKAITAIDAGKFKDEIVPVEVPGRKGSVQLIEEDETPRRDTSLEKLAGLPPAFKADGKVTAGNAPGLNDGAAAVLYASRAKADELGLSPMARVVGYAQAAVPPKELFSAPAHAVPRLLERIGWSLEEVDLVELNEAFAAQVLADGFALEAMGWDWDKVNVNGGAIALGHPLGATGAALIGTALDELERTGKATALITLCIGGGMGIATILERI
jgi:acetyl-CoA C-acetyltransferase